MNGVLLLLPMLLIRYGLLYLLNRDALRRAAFFPPMEGGERIAYWVYQLCTSGIFIYLCFLRLQVGSAWFYIGLGVYGLGVVIFGLATASFARPSDQGVNEDGLYRVSRNPMYVGYFVYFLGCVLLTRSAVLLGMLVAFQVSAHWIILAEERWCAKELGEGYVRYMGRVRRYL